MRTRWLWLGWLALWSALLAQTPTLHTLIDPLLDVDWLRYGYCGIVVRDLQTGETLYQRDAERVLIPASNNKLLVTACALTVLGAEYRMRTEVWRNGTLEPDGTLQGDLILVGKGDASLLYSDLQALARQIREKGIQQVQGRLLYDDTWLDAERYGFGWNIDDEPYGYQAQMSALCVERNAVRVYASPTTDGKPPTVRLEPPTDYVQVINLARTTTKGQGNPALSATRLRARNTVILTGTIPEGASEVFVGRYSVENPSRYTAHLFLQALREAGVSIAESISPTALSLYPKAEPIAIHLSPPMSEIIALINKPSDNLLTEMVLKILGKERRGEGTTQAGIRVLTDFLRSAGLEMDAVQVVDGSGLSRMNAISPENLVRLLIYMARSPHAEAYRRSLPVYGEDGTLRNRLRNTPVQGNGFVKTGSLYRVSSLSGYLLCKSGRIVAFAIVMNHYTASGADVRRLQDAIVQALWENL